MESILILEDQAEYRKLIELSLGLKYVLEFAESIKSASLKIKTKSFDLFLLDVILPDGSGYDFYNSIQASGEYKDIPVIFLTSKASPQDIVFGFSLGADDYMVKPFEPSELRARIEVRILKSNIKRQNQEFLKKGPLTFELGGVRLFVTADNENKRVDVTPIEFKILLKLVQCSNTILSRRQILDSVWGDSVYIDDRCIDKHISSIRKKISPFQNYIKTISGIGYEFVS